jgi:hypothetical protein
MSVTRVLLQLGLATVIRASVALGAPAGDLSKEPSPTSCGYRAKWTIIYYSNGDNDLEADIRTDLYEAALEGSSPLPEGPPAGTIDRHILMLLDTKVHYSDAQTFSIRVEKRLPSEDWDGESIEKLAGKVVRLSEKNMAEGGTLRTYLTQALECYPADKVALIINGHGSGVRAHERRTRVANDLRTRAFGVDLNSPEPPSVEADVLYVAEAVGAIRAALAQVGRDQLDLVGLDTCLMSTIEVGYAFRSVTPLLVASENTEGTAGWDHSRWLRMLESQPDATARDLARAITTTYEAGIVGTSAAVRNGLIKRRTLVATSLPPRSGRCLHNGVASVVESINTLGAQVVRRRDHDFLITALREARGQCLSFGPASNSELNVDLGCVMDALRLTLENRNEEYRTVLDYVENISSSLLCMVDVESSSLGPDIGGPPAIGLSIFLPKHYSSAIDSDIYRDRHILNEQELDGHVKFPMPFFQTAIDWADLLGDSRLFSDYH